MINDSLKYSSDFMFETVEDAVKKLSLSKKVKWKTYLGYLCRYTKKDTCPTFVYNNGIPVQIKNV